jgi:hypothetical protein
VARKVEIEIVGDSRSLERAFSRVGREGSKLERGLRGIGKASAIAIGVGAGAGLVGLGLAAKASLGEFIQAQKVVAQTNAVIESTGGAANVTAKHVDRLSNSLLRKTGIDDEVIQSGENMLLTFRGVRNEIGRSNDIFDQATKIGLDMSTALAGAGFEGGNLKTTMIRLGKALNDPVQGMTALKRVGVTFTEAQKATIKRLEETGHHLEAQKLILHELKMEFGGSAEAYGKTLPGQLMIFKETLRNVGAFVVGKFVPVLTGGMKVIEKFGGFIDRIAHAKNLKVGLSITTSGVKDFAMDAKAALSDAFLGSTEVIAGGSQGYVRVFHDGLLQSIQRQDWSLIGKSIAAGIGASLVFTTETLDKLLSGLLDWVTAHTQQFAEVGATIAVRMALTLTDPVFWAHHLDLLALVLITGFSKGIGKLAGFAGRAMVRLLGPAFERGAGEAALFFMRGIGRLPGMLGDTIAVLISVAGAGFRQLGREIVRPLAEETGRISGFLVKAFRLGAVITVFRLGILGMQSAWSGFTSWIKERALRIVLSIAEPFSHLPGRMGGWARDLKDNINRQLDQIHHRVPITVEVKVKMPSGARGPVGTTGDGIIGAVTSSTRAFAAANPSMLMPPMASATGSAAGLKPMILDDLALGRSMGLSLSSGYRPGSVTSSGNPSLHGVGQAIDMVGSPFAMANYAMAEAGRSGIAEVIYSPVGWWHPGSGWGPVTDPQIKRDHYSHVHVGARSGDGRVGVGDGRADWFGRRLQTQKTLRRQRARAKIDFSQAPNAIAYAISASHLTPDSADDLTALRRYETYLTNQLKRKGLTLPQKTQIIDALVGVRGEIATLLDTGTEPGPTPAPEPDPDLLAQLAQANARLGVANRSAALANAFVATGVFAGGGAGGGGSAPIVFQSLFPPTPEQARQAAAAAAEGAGMQGYRTTSQDRLGV